MTKYLIVKCEELFDQYECDADREPMFLVDDWKKWYQDNHPNYLFEVYKFEDDKECTLEKHYDDYVDHGMALYFWDINDDREEKAPTVIAYYKDYNRNKKVPDKVWKVFRQGTDDDEFTEEDFKNDLHCQGYASWEDKEHKKCWVYGYYEDGRFCLGY